MKLFKPRSRGFVLKPGLASTVRGYSQVGCYPVEFKQEYKLTEKQGFVALEILNPNQKCYRSEKKY